MKKRIFIGSSSEELALATIAKDILEPTYEVVIWNDKIWDTAVFRLNQNFLSDLMKATLKFDYGILIGTTDDKVIMREKVLVKPRDNVTFELGLFLGRLGVDKCAFLIEKELDLLSDLQGISLARYSKGDAAEFASSVKRIAETFENAPTNNVTFFPSSTLASVYFESFIKPLYDYILSDEGFQSKDGKANIDKVVIIMPEVLNDDVNIQFVAMKKMMTTEIFSFPYKGRPRNISVDIGNSSTEKIIVDFPTVLGGINHAIKNLMPSDFNAFSPDYDLILKRELNRFRESLQLLLVRNQADKYITIVTETDYFK